MWKVIKKFEGYEASDDGQIRRADGKLLKQFLANDGYYVVNLCSRTYKVHRLMAMAFLDLEQKKNIVVDHVNNIRTDNRICNLQIISHRLNITKDRKRKNRFPYVYKDNRPGKCWRATIRVNNKSIYIGRFHTDEEAYQAVVDYKKNNNIF